MARNQKDTTYDVATILKDAGLVAASAAAQVSGAAQVLDLGAARIDGRVVVDTTAVETDTGDEIYEVIVQGSNSPTFANTIVTLGEMRFGAAATTLESAVTPAVGRREIGVTNEVNGTTYRYMRLWTKVAGTIATGINYSARLVEKA